MSRGKIMNFNQETGKRDPHRHSSPAHCPETKSKEPPLDPQKLDELRELSGQENPLFFTSILEQFLHDGPNDIHAICQAFEKGKAQTLMGAVHGLKGACQFIGANALAQICFELEQQGKSCEIKNMKPLISELTTEFDRVKTFIHAEIAKNTTPLPS